MTLGTATIASTALAVPHGDGYYDYYDHDYADGCWQRRLVPTPYGMRWRLVDVRE